MLSDEIIRALVEMKFHNPTEIQRVSIPVSVYGKCDILGAAPTGSGKTLGEIIKFKIHWKFHELIFFSFWHSDCAKHSKGFERQRRGVGRSVLGDPYADARAGAADSQTFEGDRKVHESHHRLHHRRIGDRETGASPEVEAAHRHRNAGTRVGAGAGWQRASPEDQQREIFRRRRNRPDGREGTFRGAGGDSESVELRREQRQAPNFRFLRDSDDGARAAAVLTTDEEAQEQLGRDVEGSTAERLHRDVRHEESEGVRHHKPKRRRRQADRGEDSVLAGREGFVPLLHPHEVSRTDDRVLQLHRLRQAQRVGSVAPQNHADRAARQDGAEAATEESRELPEGRDQHLDDHAGVRPRPGHPECSARHSLPGAVHRRGLRAPLRTDSSRR